jgi:soluble lytic murein transglycosylase
MATVPNEAVPLLKTWIEAWHNAAYFDDIMDRLSRQLVSKRDWETMLDVYRLLKPQAGGTARAQYAYILGRAAELGFLTGVNAETMFRFARDEAAASLYYRALASHKLKGMEIPGTLEISDTLKIPGPSAPRGQPLSVEFDFLTGFFQYGAAHLAWPSIVEVEKGLAVEELRELVCSFQEAGFWGESLRLIARYQEREGYLLEKADLELSCPRPYRELIETYAAEQNIPPEILFGLIRTESAFTAEISSRVGALGLAQLMPDTAEEMAARLSRNGGPDYRREEGLKLSDPETNIHLGAVYLRYLLDRLENPMLALLAYNGGMGRVRRWKAGAPDLPADLLVETVEFDETRAYGKKVAAAAAAYGFLYYNLTLEAGIADTLK